MFTFTSEQNFAINCLERNVIIQAGPGSGKTTVLCHRVKKFFENQLVKPEETLIVSYSNEAVKNIKNKLKQLVPADQSEIVEVTTFHGICCAMLRKEGQAFSVIDKDESIELLGTMKAKLSQYMRKGVPSKKILYKEIMRYQSFGKNVVDWTFEAPGRLVKASNVSQLVRAYCSLLRRNNMIDFGAMLMMARDMLKNNDNMSPYKAIFVDEYQDVSPIMIELTLFCRAML